MNSHAIQGLKLFHTISSCSFHFCWPFCIIIFFLMINKVTWHIESTYGEVCIAPLFEWAFAWKPSCYDRIPIFTRLISSIYYCFTEPLFVRVNRTHLRDELTIVLRSRDITGDYWVETNWWPQEKIRDTNIGETLGFCWNFTGFLLVSLRSVPTLEMWYKYQHWNFNIIYQCW